MMNRPWRRASLVVTLLALCVGCVPLGPEDVPYTPLEKAILIDDLAWAQRLLDEGADPTEATPNHGPLDIAVARANVQMVKLLIDNGAAEASPQGQWGSYFVYLATDRGPGASDAEDLAVAKLLVDAGLDPCVRMKGTELYGLLPSQVADKDGRTDFAAELRGLEVN